MLNKNQSSIKVCKDKGTEYGALTGGEYNVNQM